MQLHAKAVAAITMPSGMKIELEGSLFKSPALPQKCQLQSSMPYLSISMSQSVRLNCSLSPFLFCPVHINSEGSVNKVTVKSLVESKWIAFSRPASLSATVLQRQCNTHIQPQAKCMLSKQVDTYTHPIYPQTNFHLSALLKAWSKSAK